MSAVPLVNATLTRLEGQGASEDNGLPAGPRAELWAGSEGAYAREELLTVARDGREDQIDATRLVIPAALARLVARGDFATYTRASRTHTREVRDIERFEAFGTARLTFWEA